MKFKEGDIVNLNPKAIFSDFGSESREQLHSLAEIKIKFRIISISGETYGHKVEAVDKLPISLPNTQFEENELVLARSNLWQGGKR